MERKKGGVTPLDVQFWWEELQMSLAEQMTGGPVSPDRLSQIAGNIAAYSGGKTKEEVMAEAEKRAKEMLES
jgi:hypothetical protein